MLRVFDLPPVERKQTPVVVPVLTAPTEKVGEVLGTVFQRLRCRKAARSASPGTCIPAPGARREFAQVAIRLRQIDDPVSEQRRYMFIAAPTL